MKYTNILMDLDGTVFDFDHAERSAFYELCREFDLPCSEEKYSFYQKANVRRWKEYEMGLLPKEKILRLRFDDFLEEFNIVLDSRAFSERYMDLLVLNTKLFEGAYDVLSKIKKEYVLDAVTNATIEVQKKKLEITSMEGMFNKLFISGEIGYPKPSEKFFTAVFNYYKDVPRENFLVVGDSLSADIQGAANSGLDSVWVSNGRLLEGNSRPTFVINRINELYDLLRGF